MTVVVCTVFLLNRQDSVWIDQRPVYVWLGLVFGLITWLNQIVYKIVDAHGLTVKGELAVVKQRLLGLFILGLMMIVGKFSLFLYFVYNYLILIVMLVFWKRILNQHNISLFPRNRLASSQIRGYGSEFYQFSMPLFVGGVFSFVIGFADRWLLQLYGGSVEQGLFGLSYRIGALCFLFTGAIVPLFQREMAKAFKNNSTREAKEIFSKYVPMFYSLAVAIAAIFFFQAENVGMMLGGVEFRNASVSIAIMSLYPIHQTYGQLNSAVYFASGRTRLYRNIGILKSTFGLLVTYLVLAPTDRYGLNLGSAGLAFKMVIVQIIGQNINLFYNVRLLNIKYRHMLKNQILSVLVIGSLAGLVSYVLKEISTNAFISFGMTGILYLALLGGTIYLAPGIFGIKRDMLESYYQSVRGYLMEAKWKNRYD